MGEREKKGNQEERERERWNERGRIYGPIDHGIRQRRIFGNLGLGDEDCKIKIVLI